MNRQKRIEIFERFKRINPHPTTELEYSSPFELLISVILSAQATDVGVNKATSRLYKIANTPQHILDLGLDTLKDYVKTIGLYNTKAQNIIKTCQILVDKYHGQVPDNRKALESLPGVGRKTANVVLNTVFGHPTMAVDTHIFRVARRTKIAHGKNVLEVEKSLLRLIPKEYLMNAHHWLILHGRYICKARKPNCKECIINDLCEYNAKNL
jgi:endonuclease-3